jgi:hypothetical protein
MATDAGEWQRRQGRAYRRRKGRAKKRRPQPPPRQEPEEGTQEKNANVAGGVGTCSTRVTKRKEQS